MQGRVSALVGGGGGEDHFAASRNSVLPSFSFFAEFSVWHAAFFYFFFEIVDDFSDVPEDDAIVIV